MASNASATPPPQINISQEALQGLASTVYELLKDSMGKTMQDMVQHTASVNSVACNASGVCASVSDDQCIRVCV